MKLINKSTGEIGKLHCDMNVSPAKYGVFEDTDIRGHYWEYESLAELNAEWEDYTPSEPLIKDEKVRKAVRAWAEGNDVLEVFIDRIGDGTYIELYDEDDGRRRISALRPAGLKTGEAYTIDELCGEEE